MESAVCANYAQTAADGKNYQTIHYNLDVIISVGYRVKSLRGTQFRIWATQRLREQTVEFPSSLRFAPSRDSFYGKIVLANRRIYVIH
jgi:hypothetical protein